MTDKKDCGYTSIPADTAERISITDLYDAMNTLAGIEDGQTDDIFVELIIKRGK